MTQGEIVGVESLAAGTKYAAVNATGVLATAGGTEIGFTVEATRLVVRANGNAVA